MLLLFTHKILVATSAEEGGGGDGASAPGIYIGGGHSMKELVLTYNYKGIQIKNLASDMHPEPEVSPGIIKPLQAICC